MPKKKRIQSIVSVIVIFTAAALMPTEDSSFAAVTQVTPSVSITEEYTDNYNQTEDDTEEEWSTTYQLGLLFEYLAPKAQTTLWYSPSYVDYDDYDDNDSWEHDASLNSTFELTRYTDLTFSDSFARRREINRRTGTWTDHDTNFMTARLTNRFGRDSQVGLGYSYDFDDYDQPNADEYDRHGPTVFLTYWLDAKHGLDSSIWYERTEFDLTDNDEDVFAGDIRLIRRLTKQFQVYVKYAHSYSEDDFEEHTVYNPSVGFDWEVSETSSVSAGAGVLFNRYDEQEDSEDFFFEVDAFKLFPFSRRGSFSLSASSGYDESGDEAASLGFVIYYRVGFNYNYELTKRSSLDISGYYRREDYNEEYADRVDNTLDLSAGINWTPLKWMTLSTYYSYTNFDTDAGFRNDYEENRVAVTVSLYPYRPARINPLAMRDAVEGRIFDR